MIKRLSIALFLVSFVLNIKSMIVLDILGKLFPVRTNQSMDRTMQYHDTGDMSLSSAALTETECSKSLIVACGCGDFNKVKEYIQLGADVNTVDCNGYTPLIKAANKGCLNIVKYLISKGANVNAKAYVRNNTALSMAIREGHYQVVKELLKYIDRSCLLGVFLIDASFHGHKKILKALIDKGASLNGTDCSLQTALCRRHKDIANILDLEYAISQNNKIELYVNQIFLYEEDWIWFVNRALNDVKIENLLSEDYKEIINIYRQLKVGAISEEDIKIIWIITSDKVKKVKLKKGIYYKLNTCIRNILYLNQVNIPVPLAAIIALEY